MDWYPHALLRAEQVCGRRFSFFLETDMCLIQKGQLLVKNILCLVILNDCIFLETPNRHGSQFHTIRCRFLFLSSPLDPIGDQNDVRELLSLFIILGLCLLFVLFFFSIYIPTQPLLPA